ncbi:hypothetical protein WG68_02565 [Arsukibacterium ikkense]|uniref:Uncharacterized protein n=1 Tax=Arsukibacterium ikkense TaxID=336831 RepID=A0A0M2V8A6_9GAMM|nr:hypothetical protein WG68_02565 [Arsukibacterium ikkense]
MYFFQELSYLGKVVLQISRFFIAFSNKQTLRYALIAVTLTPDFIYHSAQFLPSVCFLTQANINTQTQ